MTNKNSIYFFGPWVEQVGNEPPNISEEGKLIAKWLEGKSINELELWAEVDEFEKLLRKEIAAQKQYRDVLWTEFSLYRNKILDEANAVVPDLGNPGSSIVEAYNNGLNMGKHQGLVEIAQGLSDILDRLCIMEARNEND